MTVSWMFLVLWLAPDGSRPGAARDILQPAVTFGEARAMIGTTIRHYHIIEKLGAGGMGVVYKAQDVVLRRPVALKFLPADSGDDDERRARLQREARVAAALNHPNICTVYEVGKVEAADSCAAAEGSAAPVGTPFIAMEFVDGEMLATRLARLGTLPVREVLDVAVQVASGLAEAHASQIVHRDLKPQNVMITAAGRVKVLDFGLAKPLDAVRGVESMVTTAQMISADFGEGTIMGTVAYMSPEQALGKPIDSRSDIFAFGIMLYELITGRQPFLADTTTATLARILEAEPPLEAIDNVPPDLMRIVRRCLQKKPADRYVRTDDLLRELENVRRRMSTRSTLIRNAIVRPWSRRTDSTPPVTRRLAQLLWAVWELNPPIAVFSVLLLVVVLAWYVAQWRSNGPTSHEIPTQEANASVTTRPADTSAAAPVPPVSASPPVPAPLTTAATSPAPPADTLPRPPIQPQKPGPMPAAGRSAPPAAAPASSPTSEATMLALSSDPRASLLLDGDLVGISPVTIETRPGTHEVVMTTPEGLRWRGRVEIAAGEKKSVHRNLNARGSLTITADTWAEVSLDGGAVEQTPIHLSHVAAGLHDVRASRDGYLPQVLEVTIEDGRTTRIQLKLEKKP